MSGNHIVLLSTHTVCSPYHRTFLLWIKMYKFLNKNLFIFLIQHWYSVYFVLIHVTYLKYINLWNWLSHKYLFQLQSGNYTVVLKAAERNKHFRVQVNEEGLYQIGQQKFANLDDLIEHYKKHPIFRQESEKLYLVKAFNLPAEFWSFWRRCMGTSLINGSWFGRSLMRVALLASLGVQM